MNPQTAITAVQVVLWVVSVLVIGAGIFGGIHFLSHHPSDRSEQPPAPEFADEPEQLVQPSEEGFESEPSMEEIPLSLAARRAFGWVRREPWNAGVGRDQFRREW